MSFAADLARYGPDQRDAVALDDARAYCARLARSHYENFSVVSWLTPRHLRPAFEAVYAFCRWSDDLGDEIGDRARSTELLAWWRSELRAMFEGKTRHPVFVALAPVTKEFNIPIEPFQALISAFEQDQVVTNYETYDQLLDYCTRSANPVGHLVLYLARAYNPGNAQLADATCTALQLANFWQDVARDLAIGRIYLPREHRERFGVSEDDLRIAPASVAVRELLAYEVKLAEELFARGRPLAGRLTGRMAVCVDLFSKGGLAILDRIRRQNYDVLSARPALGKGSKLRLLLSALWSRPARVSPRGIEAALPVE